MTKRLKKHVKILSALSLASSDRRKDTFISVIIRTLYDVTSCDKKEISGYINEKFGFVPYPSELEEILYWLKEENQIEIEGDIIKLSDSEKAKIDSQDLIIKDNEKQRFQNFKNFIIDELNEEIDGPQIKALWNFFLQYLYNSFFEFGEDALSTLHPHIQSEHKNGYYESILSIILKEIEGSKNKELFKVIIERFPDFASSDDIDFLNELAQKTLSFSSLGFEPKIARETLEHDLIDWVLYLDTNVLYSLLNLHSHPENEACNALVKLIINNQEHVKIKLRYSEITSKELMHKKVDFKLLDTKLSDSSIKAMLKSDNLDGFSQKYYESLLAERDSTIHPNEVIELSQSTLKRDAIEIARNAKRIEQLGEGYIDSKVGEYLSFVEKRNNIKMEFCLEKKTTFNPIYKSEKQALHDIKLRELLMSQRTNNTNESDVSLNSVKYFGVTLDGLLIKFDRAQMKQYGDESSFPVFFKPSFLLNKLVRSLPIKTDDYKKAFIKAITSRGFHKDASKSRDVMKIVNYLKKSGIDDERVVYNLISQDIFLENYAKSQNEQDFNEAEFIESELNREFKETKDKLEETESQLFNVTKDSENKSEENKKLKEKKKLLDSDISQYKSALQKLHDRVKELEVQQPIGGVQKGINFEAEEQKTVHEKDKNGLSKKYKQEILNQIETEKNLAIKKWQNAIWWNLFWVVPLVLLSLFIVIPNEYIEITKQADRFKWAGLVFAPVVLIFLALINYRYWNEGNKTRRKENHIVSSVLKEKLNNLDNE